MSHKVRIIIEKVDAKTNDIIEKVTVEEYNIKESKAILDLGLRHKTPVELLRKVQQYILEAQAVAISNKVEFCTNFGHKLKKIGYKESNLFGPSIKSTTIFMS